MSEIICSGIHPYGATYRRDEDGNCPWCDFTCDSVNDPWFRPSAWAVEKAGQPAEADDEVTQ